MKITTIIGAAALAGATLALTAALPLQDAKAKSRGDDKKAEKAAHGMDPAMMEAWVKAGTPGEHHAALAKCAGKWNLQVKHWMDPSAPPEESEATAKFEMVMGGRYLIENVSGESEMGPFEGMGITAFDNLSEQVINVWIDNWSTGVMVSRGSASESGGYMVKGEYPDPMTGGVKKTRMEMKVIDANERFLTMWEERDGSEVKTMEIAYKRGQGAGY